MTKRRTLLLLGLAILLVRRRRRALGMHNPKLHLAVEVFLSKPSHEFQNTFRLPRDMFESIVEAIRPDVELYRFDHLLSVFVSLQPHRGGIRLSKTAEAQLMSFLLYIGDARSYRQVGDLFDMSRRTAHKSVWSCSCSSFSCCLLGYF